MPPNLYQIQPLPNDQIFQYTIGIYRNIYSYSNYPQSASMNCSSQLLLCNKSPQHLVVFSAGVYSLTVDWVFGQSCGGSCLSFSPRLQSWWCGQRLWSFLRPLTEKNELSIRCWAEASSPLYMMPIEMHIEYGHWPSTEPESKTA